MKSENDKRKKYKELAEKYKAKMIPFIMETSGGIGPAEWEVVKMIFTAAHDHHTMWHQKMIEKELMGEIAIAIQRGNARTMIAGFVNAVGVIPPQAA